MSAVIIGLIGSVITAIPGLFSIGTKAKVVYKVADTTIDVSQIARDMLTNYLNISEKATVKQIEAELKRLDRSQAFELQKLEIEFKHKLEELGVQSQFQEYELAAARLRLVELDYASESWLDHGWRRVLRWTCVLTVFMTTLLAAIVGSVGVYYPEFTPLFQFLSTQVATDEVYTLIGLMLGVAYSARSYEKVMLKGK